MVMAAAVLVVVLAAAVVVVVAVVVALPNGDAEDENDKNDYRLWQPLQHPSKRMDLQRLSHDSMQQCYFGCGDAAVAASRREVLLPQSSGGEDGGGGAAAATLLLLLEECFDAVAFVLEEKVGAPEGAPLLQPHRLLVCTVPRSREGGNGEELFFSSCYYWMSGRAAP